MTMAFTLSIQNDKIPVWRKFVELHRRKSSRVIMGLIEDYMERVENG